MVLFVSGCATWGDAACAQRGVVEWEQAGYFDAAERAGLPLMQGPRHGISFAAGDVVAAYGEAQLVEVFWQPGAPESDSASVSHTHVLLSARPGAVRLQVTLPADATEDDLHRVYVAFMDAVSDAAPEPRDAWEAALRESLHRAPEGNAGVPAHAHGVNIEGPFRVDALWREHGGLEGHEEAPGVTPGQLFLWHEGWRFAFRLPMREAVVNDGSLPFALVVDSADRASAAVRSDETGWLLTNLNRSLDRLGMPPATAGPDAVRVEGC